VARNAGGLFNYRHRSSARWPSSSSSSSGSAGRCPRFRYDQLMRRGLGFFFEIALVNIFIAAIIIAYFPR
jgi:hypothetical protein